MNLYEDSSDSDCDDIFAPTDDSISPYMYSGNKEGMDIVNEIREEFSLDGDMREIKTINQIHTDFDSRTQSGITDDSLRKLAKTFTLGNLSEGKICSSLLDLAVYVNHVLNTQNSDKEPYFVTDDMNKDIVTIKNSLMNIIMKLPPVSKRIQPSVSEDTTPFYFDVLCFSGVLQCVWLLSFKDSIKTFLSSITLRSFPELIRSKTIPQEFLISNIRVDSLKLHQIMQILMQLEATWINIPFSENLVRYVEVILIVASKYYLEPHSFEDYKLATYVSDTSVKETNKCYPSQLLLQDICWSIIPIYKKLTAKSVLNSNFETSEKPYPKQLRKNFKANLVAYTKHMKNKSLSEKLRNNIFALTLRPSEKNRYIRDYPGKLIYDADIIKRSRSKQYVKTYFTYFSQSPWSIISNIAVDKFTKELLLLMMFDSFFSNKIGLEWMKTFVIFNNSVQEHVSSLSEVYNLYYPMVIQDFNHYNLIHNNTLYVHKTVLSTLLHWVEVMQGKPYDGVYKYIDINPALHETLKYTKKS